MEPGGRGALDRYRKNHRKRDMKCGLNHRIESRQASLKGKRRCRIEQEIQPGPSSLAGYQRAIGRGVPPGKSVRASSRPTRNCEYRSLDIIRKVAA